MLYEVITESVIIDRTLEHALKYFDRIFIADHLSDDGTKEILEAKA